MLNEMAPDTLLMDAIGECYANPLRYVVLIFEWSKGPLEGHKPRPWQIKYLKDCDEQIRARKFNVTNPVKPITSTQLQTRT